MDKIKKFLRKLLPQEREAAEIVIAKLVAKEFVGLDIRKLKGMENIFRVRKGNLRVLYTP